MAYEKLLNYETFIISQNHEWIVMIHGAGGSTKTWKYQTPAFNEGYNILLIDLRDHGDSKFEGITPSNYSFGLISEDIKRVMNHLEITRAHFITLSLGSAMIQHFMMVYPESVHKVVFAGGIFKANKKLRAAAQFAKGLSYLLPYKLMYRLFSFIAMPKKRNQKARQIFIQQAKKLTSIEYRKWIGLETSFFEILKQSFYYRFDHESLVVMGSEDYAFIQNARNYAMHQPFSKFIELKGAGHICNIESPDIFNMLALNFLRDERAPRQKPRSKELSYTN
jgi:pimeloyl-ACP methyl ester carboxylesterase